VYRLAPEKNEVLVGFTVLLVDDDETTLDLGSRLLQLEGWLVRTAATGGEARDLVTRIKPDIALIDLKLPDESGLEVLRVVRALHPLAVCVIVTGHATCRSTVDAIKRGAFDVVEKPLYGDALVDLVHRAAAALQAAGTCEQHAFRRWAEVVCRAVAAPSDPRTLAQWGRAVGASRGAIRSWCHTAGIAPRRSLLFMRLLRAVIWNRQTQAGFEQLLDVVDRRTLMKLAALSGSRDGAFPSTVDEFLAQQQLVKEPAAIELLAALSRELPHCVGIAWTPAADPAALRNGLSI
jgi:CheY-like chemotaxis protein